MKSFQKNPGNWKPELQLNVMIKFSMVLKTTTIEKI